MSKVIRVGNVKIGGKNPVVVKGMFKGPLQDRRRLLREAELLKEEGCQIFRIAIEKKEDTDLIPFLKAQGFCPLEADVHFNPELAFLSMDKDVDCIRLNPLNISNQKIVKSIGKYARRKNIPIRVGVNSGGLRNLTSESSLVKKLFESLSFYVRSLEEAGTSQIIISAKTSSVKTTVEINRLLKKKFSYPLSLGLTATGPFKEGLIKSCLALGVLLFEGIGDTLRLSLNTSSWQEVRLACFLLQALGLRRCYPEIISCPTCSRCKVDLRKKVEELRTQIYKRRFPVNLKIAIMGCPVNGPGEAGQADIGLAFGQKTGIIFKEKKILKKVKEEEALDSLIKAAGKFFSEKSGEGNKRLKLRAGRKG